MNKIPTSVVESRNDTNTESISPGEVSAKEKYKKLLVDLTCFGEVSK